MRGLTDSHLRGDYAPWRDLFVDVANGGFGHDDGDSGEQAFRHFYQQAQLRLFSSMDNALAAKASDAFYHYDSVKSARVQFQTGLGGRKANLGIDVIGSIMEQTGDNVKHAIGWQAHVFAGENTSKGISGGIFYRHLQNQMLHGVNLFADYESNDYGDFYRYGIGGEVRHEYVAFAANYYIPLTDDIRINESLVAYSREGYDANLQVAIPGARYLKAEAAFYHFDGKHENEADNGFRYGAALSPANGILLKLFYDNGGEEFGGALSWRYNFHPAQEGPQVHHDTPRMSSADLFAPVLREHSQRIAIATVIAGFPVFGIVARNVEHQQISPVATLYIPQGYFAGLPSLRAAVSLGGEDESSMRPTSVSFSDVSLPNITVIYHSGESFIGDANPVEIILQGTVGGVLTATSFFMTVAHYRTFAASFAAMPVLSHFTAAVAQTVGTIQPRGGVLPYNFRSSRPDVSIDNNGLVLFDTEGREKTITAILTTDDAITQTPPVLITLILAAFADALLPANAPFVVGVQSPAATILLPGGRVAGSLPSGFAVQDNTVVLFNPATPGQTSQTLIITSAAQTITASLTLTAFSPIGGSFGGYHSSVFVTQFLGTVGTLSVSGGSGDYVYDAPSGFLVESGGVIRASSNAAMTLTLTATIVARDARLPSPPVSVIVSVKFITRCDYAAGCDEFGHLNLALPPLPRATLMHNAGVRAVGFQGQSPRNYVSDLLVRIADEGRPFYQFIIDTGQINDVPPTGFPAAGEAPLDIANRSNPPQVMWLADRGARCNLNCRIGQTNLSGGMCIRDTGFATSVPAGADCTTNN